MKAGMRRWLLRTGWWAGALLAATVNLAVLLIAFQLQIHGNALLSRGEQLDSTDRPQVQTQ